MFLVEGCEELVEVVLILVLEVRTGAELVLAEAVGLGVLVEEIEESLEVSFERGVVFHARFN